MHLMNRRRFLLLSALSAASVKASARAPRATIRLQPRQLLAEVPASFIGLSYETQQLSNPDFFSPYNQGLIDRVRALSPTGVLRLGGNTSDVGWWKATPDATQPPLPTKVFIVPPRAGERPFQELAYAIGPEAILNLRGFLDATGWRCLYGINLGTSTPARAAEEAAFVARTLGDRLQYFQLGNEPDYFMGRFRNKADWTVDTYLDEWLASARAILAVVPGAKFGLPDTGEHPEWALAVADRLSALLDHSFVSAISHHHYFGGPPTNPEVSIDKLLQPQPAVRTAAATMRTAAARLNTQYRLTEGNTCWGGGKPGVSDVFAASLWAADYLLTLASLGYAGVNLHGGDGTMVANSLGGRLAGDDMVKDDPATHPRPYYTPIAHLGDGFVAEPVSFGMRFAAAFAGATMVDLEFDSGDVNASAFAARLDHEQTVIAVINKDSRRSLEIAVDGHSMAEVRRMTASNLTAREVSLEAKPTARRLPLAVPPASAALLFLKG